MLSGGRVGANGHHLEQEALLQAVEKIAASPLFRSAESLCSLLRYLARQSIDQPGSSPKEYQIATEVFGRPSDFDSRLDSTVRVQTGRLRSKLAEYYAGSEDDLVIEVPKGSYSLTVHHRDRYQGANVAPSPKRSNRWGVVLLTLAVVAVATGVLLRIRAGSETARPSGATRVFWQIFVGKKQSPLVAFSNAEFVGAPALGMRYFNSATDSPRDIRDHYTGIGEVMAVHALDQLFARFGCEMRLKRGRQLDWDNAKGGDLIFIGSTAENLSLRELSEQRDFVFKLKESPPRKDEVAIFNLRPHPGEEPLYLCSPGLPVTEDYALIALLPVLEGRHWVLILAGTTTLGTQAATEYVCHPDTLQNLLNRLHFSDPANPVAFEAVIKAQISGGVPIESQIVALHVRTQRRP